MKELKEGAQAAWVGARSDAGCGGWTACASAVVANLQMVAAWCPASALRITTAAEVLLCGVRQEYDKRLHGIRNGWYRTSAGKKRLHLREHQAIFIHRTFHVKRASNSIPVSSDLSPAMHSTQMPQ
jgi:hypothetical protein